MATKKKKPARKAATKTSTPKRAPKSPAVAQRQQPESLRLRSLAASLTVNDLTRSIAWYRDVLRFTPGERWEDNGKLLGIQMKAGLCDLMLSQDDFAKGRDRAKGDGVRLWLATAQDIAAIAARIKGEWRPVGLRAPGNSVGRLRVRDHRSRRLQDHRHPGGVAGFGSTGISAASHTVHPPIRARALGQPASLNSRATRALVASLCQAQYATSQSWRGSARSAARTATLPSGESRIAPCA